MKRNIWFFTVMLLLVGLLIAADYNDIIPKTETKEIFVFSMDGCSGCEAMKPIVKELQDEDFNIRIVVDLGLREKFNITAVPTTVVIIRGKEVRRRVGTLSKETLIAFIGKD